MSKPNKITDVRCYFEKLLISMEGRPVKAYFAEDAVAHVTSKEIFLGPNANYKISWKKVSAFELQEGWFELQSERHSVKAIAGDDRNWSRCSRMMEKQWNKRNAKEERRRQEEQQNLQPPSVRRTYNSSYSKKKKSLAFLAKNENRNDWDSDGDDQIFNHTYQKPKKEIQKEKKDQEQQSWKEDGDSDAGEAVFETDDGGGTSMQPISVDVDQNDNGTNKAIRPAEEETQGDKKGSKRAKSSRGKKSRVRKKNLDDDSDDDDLFNDPKLTTPNAKQRIVSPNTLTVNRLGFANDDDDDDNVVVLDQEVEQRKGDAKVTKDLSSFFAPNKSRGVRLEGDKKVQGGVLANLGNKRSIQDQEAEKERETPSNFFASRKKQKQDIVSVEALSDDETSTVIPSQASQIMDEFEKAADDNIVSTPRKIKPSYGSKYFSNSARRSDPTEEDSIVDSPVVTSTARKNFRRKRLHQKTYGSSTKVGSTAMEALQLADVRSMSPSFARSLSPKRRSLGSRFGGKGSPGRSIGTFSTTSPGRPSTNGWRTSSPAKTAHTPPKVPDFRGIKNIGNTCYMNSSIQMLYSVPQFVSQINHGRGKERPIVSSLAGLFDQLADRTKYGSAMARDLKMVIDEGTDKFRGYQQRDANEFVGDLLDSVHEELLPSKKDDSDEMDTSKDQNKADPIGIDEDKENQHNLPTDEFFRLDVEVCLKCKSCGYSRTKEEMYRYLSVDIDNATESAESKENLDVKKTKRTVDKCLKAFFEPEDREIKCEKCEEGTVATQTLKVLNQPKAILLHLKRFVLVERPRKKFDESDESAGVEITFRKNKAPVVINQMLSLHLFLKEASGKEQSYSIKSIVHHIGSTASSGHYTADALRIRPNQPGKNVTWVSFDDTKVDTATSTDILNSVDKQKTAYMLLYSMDNMK